MKNRTLIHVGILVDSLEKSAGLERLSVSLANLLNDNGYRCTLIACAETHKPFFPANKDIEIVFLGNKSGLFHAQKLSALLNEKRISTLICVGIHQTRTAVLTQLKTRTNIIGWEQFSYASGSLIGKVWRLVSAILCNHTVVLTTTEPDYYPRWIRPRLTIIPNFTLNRPPPNYDKSSVKILSIGRLTPQKGFDLLIPVWANICKDHPNWKLVIVGDGPERQKLIDLAKQHNVPPSSIEMVPSTLNTSAHFSSAAIYILSSRFEGLPVVLTEAQMHGLPTVAFDCPTGPKEVIQNGVNGFLVPCFDLEIMQAQICMLINDQSMRAQFSAAAYENATNRFSASAVLPMWQLLIR